MKILRFTLSILLVIIVGCTKESAPDCLKKTGDIVRRELEVSSFKRILVKENIELIITEGAETTVQVESGTALIKNIEALVEGDRLILSNSSSCTNLRAYNTTKVYVTTPELTEIRSATQFPIRSVGVLGYPSLRLLSEDFVEPSEITSGAFDLTIAAEELVVVSNNLAFFEVSGTVENLNINFASGIGRFDGSKLIANNARIIHRGTNVIIVNPQQSLTGELRSTGDIVAKNKPEVIEVQKFYKGRLRFE